MKYYNLLLDICALADDPDGYDLFERAKSHFANAIKTTIEAGEYSDLDIHGYKKLKTDLVPTASEYDLGTLKILKIVDIQIDPANNIDDIRVSIKDPEEISMINNSELSPSDNDLFLMVYGDKMRGYVSSSGNFKLDVDSVFMLYYEDPRTSDFDDDSSTGTELLNYFSETYLKKLTVMAGRTLLTEDNL